MLKRYLIGVAAAAFFSGAAAGAQTYGADDPQTTPGTDTQQTEPAAPAAEPATEMAGSQTLVGCVYKEEDVPGRSPNIAERAGVLEDYILAVADQSAGETVGTAGAEGTAGTSGAAGKMFKLEHASDDELRSHVGKRVEVTGRIDAESDDTRGAGTTGSPAADESLGPDRIELPEFEVSSIREVGGDCPPQPAAR